MEKHVFMFTVYYSKTKVCFMLSTSHVGVAIFREFN